MTREQQEKIVYYLGKVNANPVKGKPPGTVLIDNVTIETRTPPIPGDGKTYECRYFGIHDPKGFADKSIMADDWTVEPGEWVNIPETLDITLKSSKRFLAESEGVHTPAEDVDAMIRTNHEGSCLYESRDEIIALIERHREAAVAERFKMPEGSEESKIGAYLPGLGLVEVPMRKADRGDPRTIRLGPIPPEAESRIEVLTLPSQWLVIKGGLTDIPDQETMRALLK